MGQAHLAKSVQTIKYNLLQMLIHFLFFAEDHVKGGLQGDIGGQPGEGVVEERANVGSNSTAQSGAC